MKMRPKTNDFPDPPVRDPPGLSRSVWDFKISGPQRQIHTMM